MNKEALLEKFRDLLASEFEIERERVTLEALLYEDLDLDSIDAVDLMAWMVKLTGKRMAPEDFKSVRSVDDVLSELQRQLC